MSLQIHRAERADRLVGALGDVLSQPLADPFATEIVSVPTPGVERWLSQRLSGRLGASPGRGDGVCAGVDFPSPRRLIARAVATATSVGVENDPWLPQRAVWPLLRVIDRCRRESWAAVLWSYLGDDPERPGRGGRRWSTARHLAGLFAQYASVRPAMVTSWSLGHDVDANGRELSADRAWQAELWRRLRDELDAPGPAARVAEAVASLRRDPATSDLPARVSLFGATRLDPDHLRVLAALAEHRDVHLWLPHPSPALWAAVAAAPGLEHSGVRRADDDTDWLVHHRLLSYLGRDSRELQRCISATGAVGVDQHHPGTEHAGPDQQPTTLLQHLQADIAANRPPRPVAERPLWQPADRSISFHASHGPDRQVEVLRELLVGLLADDPTLEPRDIVVMCPDIETFAPLIAAAFGLDTAETEAEHPGHRLRVRLADRSLRQINPLLALVSRLVALAESRVEASVVLDLCASAPVARKFGFSTDDLERLHDLVSRSGVRWGLDVQHRARFGMGDFGQNTWAAGLDRLLLGVTMDESEQHFIGTALPLDDVDASDVDLVGRLAECLSRMQLITEACSVPRTVSSWVELFKQAIDLLASVAVSDSWQLGHAYAELGGIAESAAAEDETELGLAEISALLVDAFRGRASRANFRTGTLTMCTMLPMRSVPHRVVCLLGVDDGVFPRRARLDGDNIVELEEWVGDRDPRSEDRQLLLDAVMATGDRLLVIYSGRDPRSGADTPPAVPIGELLDAVDLTARTADGAPLRSAIITKHPLQPFDLANFIPSVDAGRPLPFSFDRAALRGIRAASRDRERPAPTFAGTTLTPLATDRSVGLADLMRFYNHPLRALLRDRGGLSFWREGDEPDEQIPASLTGLDRWAVGDRLLRLHLQGVDLDTLQAAEWRRGALPPRSLGQQALTSLVTEVAELAAIAQPYLSAPPERREVVAELDPARLTGLVAGLRDAVILRVSFSRVSAKNRLQAWLELLALSATHPEQPWQAVTIGRGGQSVLGPVDSGWARMVLADLIELQRVGLASAIPFSAKTSSAYAAVRAGNQAIGPAMRELERSWRDDCDELYERFFGVGASLATLMAEPSVPEEERGSLAEPSRFGTLARRVFHPMFSAEGR